MRRRQFLGRGLRGWAGMTLAAFTPLALDDQAPLRLALFADVHHGLAPDADARLDAFAEALARSPAVDAIVQLGDFCHPGDASKAFRERFAALPGKKLHVLGNHDLDQGDKSEFLRAVGQESAHFAVSLRGMRLIVLDLNHFVDEGGGRQHYAHGNWYGRKVRPSYASESQLAWLRTELDQASEPVIIFSHQPLGIPLEGARGAEFPPEQEEVLSIVRAARTADGRPKTVLLVCGHLHVDRVHRADQLTALCINSASYHWAKGMHPYEDPLFAFLTIDPARGTIRLEGRASRFKGPHPHELGLQRHEIGVEPRISDRHFAFDPRI